MEPVYSDWRYVINGNNLKELFFCPECQRPVAALMRRYVTDRNGERYEQYRIECQICQAKGKTYQNRNVAIQSWGGGEHLPPPPKPPKRKLPQTGVSWDE